MLDVDTLYYINAAILLATSVAAYLSWHRYPEQAGLLEWSIAMATGGAGVLLLMLFAPEPSMTVSILGNGLIAVGFIVGWESMRRFNGRRAEGARVVVLVLAFLVAFSLIWYAGIGLRGRMFFRSLVMAAFAALSAWEVLKGRRDDGLVSGRRFIALVFAVITADLVLRGIGAALAPSDRPEDVYNGTVQDEAAFVTTIALIGLGLGGLSRLAGERLQAQYQTLALTDALTGLPNRRVLFDEGNRLALRVADDGVSACVMMLDVDFFRHLNERYGHPGGDRILQAVAGALTGELRRGDHVARYGGEEFCALLVDTKLAQAAVIGERLRAAVAGLAIDIGEIPGAVTVSIGLAALQPGDLKTSIERADAALYRAKHEGRNRVVIDPAETVS